MKVIDLFCSAGGSTLGAKLAGHEVVLAVDINSDALDAYQENHPEVEVWQRNILEITARDLPEADIILGSPPCTPFSAANLWTRTFDMTLTNHFLNIVRDYQKLRKKEVIWVLENVLPLAELLPSWIPQRHRRVLCAADYGVPQQRYRLMVGNYPTPFQTHARNPAGHLGPWVRFGRIREPGEHKPLSKEAIAGLLRRTHKMGLKKNNFLVRIISDEDVLYTVTTSEHHGLRAGSQIVYDNGRLRRLTFLESVRAQSFPDDYIFKGSKKERWRQVGDAVPPLLMKAVLESGRLPERLIEPPYTTKEGVREVE